MAVKIKMKITIGRPDMVRGGEVVLIGVNFKDIGMGQVATRADFGREQADYKSAAGCKPAPQCLVKDS